MNLVKNACNLLGPYFTPSLSNTPRLITAISYIALSILQGKKENACWDNMNAAVDFFGRKNEKHDISDFPAVFQKAITHGLLPYIGMVAGVSWLHNQLIILLRNPFIQDLAGDWLATLQKQAPIFQLKNAEQILANDCSRVVDLTVESVEKALKSIDIAFSIFKVYQLTKPLFHKSLPFPFNYKAGLFSVILAAMSVIAVIEVCVQKMLAKSREEERKSKEVVGALAWINQIRPQLVSLPQTNRDGVIDTLKARVKKALQASSSVQMEFVFQEHLSYSLPTVFELLTSQIAHLYAKSSFVPDMISSFPPLMRACIRLLWKFSYFMQGIMNSHTSFDLAIEKIHLLKNSLEPKTSALTTTFGDQLKLDNLSLKIDDKTLLDNFSVSLSLGKTYYLAGSNGSGKSTLCRVIQNLQEVQQGSLTCPHEIIYLEKDFGIDPLEQTFDNLLLSHFGIQDTSIINTIKSKLKTFTTYYDENTWQVAGLNDTTKRNWSTLSAGQKQILNWIVMLELAHKKESSSCLLIGDEALANLDQSNQKEMLKTLKNWMGQQPNNRGLLLIEHAKDVSSLEKITNEGTAGFEIYFDSSDDS